MARDDELAEVQRLATELREIYRQRTDLERRALNNEHGYELGLLTPYDCGLWIDERGTVYRRLGELRARWDELYPVYVGKRLSYYQKYVSMVNSSGADPPPCPSTRPFTWGVG